MKKIFISLSVLCLISFIACKKTANAAETVAENTTEVADKATDVASGAVAEGSNAMGDLAQKGLEAVGAGGLTQLLSGIPVLKDAAATKILSEYGVLIGKLVAASKTGSADTVSLQENVTTKFQEVVKVVQTLKPEEKAKVMEWLTKLTEMVKK